MHSQNVVYPSHGNDGWQWRTCHLQYSKMAVGFKKTSRHLHLLPKHQRIQDPNQIDIPSWEPKKSRTKALWKMTFLFPQGGIYLWSFPGGFVTYIKLFISLFQAKRTVKPRCFAWADLRWCQKITASPGVSPGHLEGDSAEGETLELHKSCPAFADGVLKDGRARGWGGKREKEEVDSQKMGIMWKCFF